MGLDKWGIEADEDEDDGYQESNDTPNETTTMERHINVYSQYSLSSRTIRVMWHGLLAALVFVLFTLGLAVGLAWFALPFSAEMLYVLITNLGGLVGGASTLTVLAESTQAATNNTADPALPWAMAINPGITIPGLVGLAGFGLVIKRGFARMLAPTVGHILLYILAATFPIAAITTVLSTIGQLNQTPFNLEKYTVWMVPDPVSHVATVFFAALCIATLASTAIKNQFTYPPVITGIIAGVQVGIVALRSALFWLIPIVITMSILGMVALVMTLPFTAEPLWLWVSIAASSAFGVTMGAVSFGSPLMLMVTTPVSAVHASFSIIGTQGSGHSVVLPQLLLTIFGMMIAYRAIAVGVRDGINSGLDRTIAVVPAWLGVMAAVLVTSLMGRIGATVDVVTATTPSFVPTIASALQNGMTVEGQTSYSITLLANLFPGILWVVGLTLVVAGIVFGVSRGYTKRAPKPSPYVVHLDALLRGGVITEAEYMRIRLRLDE